MVAAGHLASGRRLVRFWKGPGKQHASAAGKEVLAAVEFVRNGGADDIDTGSGMPESFAIRGVERQEVARGISSKG